MKTLRILLLSAALFVSVVVLGAAATNLLPGVRYYDSPVKLQGSLVFLYSTNGYWSSNAHIYEFNLDKKSLRVVTSSPGGDFCAAPDGQTFCVFYGVNLARAIFGTNAFVYSERLRQSRILTFEKRPTRISFIQDHAYFFFDRRVFAFDIRTGILDPQPFHHDIDAGLLKRPSLPGDKASGTGASNSTITVPDDSGHRGFKASDGRWIFFAGDSDYSSPLEGTRLVSSLLDRFHTRYDDPKGKNVRTLKRFSRPLRGTCNLDQISPCGRFALVRRSFPSGDGWSYTYYAVNIENGDTQVLLEDKVCSIGDARISYIHWVGKTFSHTLIEPNTPTIAPESPMSLERWNRCGFPSPPPDGCPKCCRSLRERWSRLRTLLESKQSLPASD